MRKFIKQFIVYFGIGGIAALVEWSVFFLVNDEKILNQNRYVATFIAFIVATFVNWIVGKKSLFSDKNKIKKGNWDIIPVFFVSAVGLLMNLFIMWLLTEVLSFGSHEQLSKIFATGIVFFWNFLARKLWVYKI